LAKEASRALKKHIKKSFAIHHWLGLLAGILILISSISGSVLVFHHEIDQAQFAGLARLDRPASALQIDKSFTHIRQAYPDFDIRIPDYPHELSQALKYELRKGQLRKWLFVQPETGQILAEVERADQRLVHTLLELHYMLLAGTPGKVVVLLVGISLILLSITGFLLYRKSILKVLSFRQKISLTSRRSFLSGLHRIVGVWSLVFNLLISLSGSYIAYTIVQGAFSSGAKSQAEAEDFSSLSVDEALREVKAAYPDFEINYLLLPVRQSGKLSVLGRLTSDPMYYGANFSRILVSARTGEIESVQFLRDQPWYTRLLTLCKPLHFGDYAGLPGKLLYCAFGLLPGLLAVSGFFIWSYRNRANRRNTRKISPKARRQQLPA
jgi:uncharacterized iron-regulated membrane protein